MHKYDATGAASEGQQARTRKQLFVAASWWSEGNDHNHALVRRQLFPWCPCCLRQPFVMCRGVCLRGLKTLTPRDFLSMWQQTTIARLLLATTTKTAADFVFFLSHAVCLFITSCEWRRGWASIEDGGRLFLFSFTRCLSVHYFVLND